MATRTNIDKIVSGINVLVRIYVVVTLSLLILYTYQKYFVSFDDMVKYTPTVFVQNVYENTNSIDFYSFVGTEHENTPMKIRDALFCKNENNLWEREILPPTKEFTLRVDKRRNRLIDEVNSEIDLSTPDSAETVRLMREFGERLASEDGFAIKYDISSLERDVERTCRFKLYYETETRFFNLPKTVSFFTHSIQIK